MSKARVILVPVPGVEVSFSEAVTGRLVMKVSRDSKKLKEVLVSSRHAGLESLLSPGLVRPAASHTLASPTTMGRESVSPRLQVSLGDLLASKRAA